MAEPPDQSRTPPWRQPRAPDIDIFLHVWVFLTNRHGAEISLSLLVGGLLVTGRTISFEAWQRETESQIRSAKTATPDFVEKLVEGLTELRIQFSADELADDREEPYYFVHLKDVTVYGAGPPFSVPLWRGRISAVEAWWLGDS